MTAIVSPARNAKPAQLTFLAHVDATPHDLEVWETAEVEAFEKAWRPDTHVAVQLRRDPAPSRGNLFAGALEVAALPAAGALIAQGGMAAISSPIGLAITAGLAAIGITAALDGARRVRASALELMGRKEPVWKGTRTFDIGPDVTPQIDSPAVASTRSTDVSRTDITRFLAERMKAYPAQVTTVMFSGHGLAWEECASLSTAEIRRCLEDSARQAGRKPDVLVLEACLMGNLEALDSLKGTARYAIVSEETMGACGLPWQQVLQDLPSHGLTPRAFGERVIAASAGDAQVSTLALIDLSKVGALSKAFTQLATALQRAVAKGAGEQVRSALEKADAYPLEMSAADRRLFQVRDLGQLVADLRATVSDPKVRRAADRVSDCLSKAVVSSTAAPGYEGASHVSVQGNAALLDHTSYVVQNGFPEWSRLIHQLQEERS
ncbi:MAG: hypothetical protein EB084_14250 [Proteobacteria bacterium]|nr:hypothetical protein [Pseudomonadota bacterium]